MAYRDAITCRENASYNQLAENGGFYNVCRPTSHLIALHAGRRRSYLAYFACLSFQQQQQQLSVYSENMYFIAKLRLLVAILLLLFFSGTLRVCFRYFFLQYTMLAKNPQHNGIPSLSMTKRLGMILRRVAPLKNYWKAISCYHFSTIEPCSVVLLPQV